MKSNLPRSRNRAVDLSDKVTAAFSQKLVGQPAAISAIVPYIQMYEAGLCPEGRPIGVFMLLGPTGTGKTRTVEALAEVLHGTSKKVLRVDCGEFQMEHEVAKLIGAPPGYLGHRETQPMLTQQKLNGISSEGHDVSILLFDEIEKAAPSMTRLLLGILDKAVLRLGDNTSVNFEKTMIFLTSNLGAHSMMKVLNPGFGFEALVTPPKGDRAVRLEKIGLAAVKRKFSPEFVNRIDSVVTYQPLSADTLSAILDRQLEELQQHIDARLGVRAFPIDVPARARRWLVKIGTSDQYGARELKRTLHRQLIQPLAALISGRRIPPTSVLRADLNDARDKIVWRVMEPELDELRPAA
jgi:ATP-dependent Clp protease ATP-binding subunit ClpA